MPKKTARSRCRSGPSPAVARVERCVNVTDSLMARPNGSSAPATARQYPPGRTDKNLCRCFGAPARRVLPDHLITYYCTVYAVFSPALQDARSASAQSRPSRRRERWARRRRQRRRRRTTSIPRMLGGPGAIMSGIRKNPRHVIITM